MKEFVVSSKQNLVDVCLQVYGTTQLLFKLAKDNNLNVDSDVSIGNVLKYDESLGDLLVKNKLTRDSLNIVNPVIEDGGVVIPMDAIHWYKSDDGPVLGTGNDITLFTDKGTNGDNLTAFGSTLPQLQPASENGLDTVFCNHTIPNYFLKGSGSNLGVNVAKTFIYTVNHLAGRQNFPFQTAGANGGKYNIDSFDTWFRLDVGGGDLRLSVDNIAKPKSIVAWRWSESANADNIEIWVDGVDQTSSLNNVGSNVPMVVHNSDKISIARSLSAFNTSIKFNELMMFDRAVTDDELSALFSYLNGKWAFY